MRFSLDRLYPVVLFFAVVVWMVLLFPNDRSQEVAEGGGELKSVPVPAVELSGGRLNRVEQAFDVWLDGYLAASVAEREGLLSAGIGLAERRRDAFARLMRRAPARALEKALPLADYVALPDELRPYFERPISGVGSIDLRWATSVVEGAGFDCQHRNLLYLDGAQFESYGEGGKAPQRPQRSVAVSGIALSGVAVLARAAIRPLLGDEIDSALALFPSGNADRVDPITSRVASGQTAALVGGQVFYFESEESIRYVAETLEAAELAAEVADRYAIEHEFDWLAASGGGWDEGDAPVDASPFQDDTLDVLFVRVDFSDFPVAPVTQGALETTLTAVKNHIEEFSYNVATLVSTVTPTVYRMPATGASYATAGDNDGIQSAARALAGADYTIGNYDVIAVFFPDLGDVPGSKITYGGLGSIGGGSHWINGINNTGVILHEFGHNYGLYHANYLDLTESLPGTYQSPGSREYGDIFDVMGSGDEPEGHFNHFAKNRLQWMPDSKVAEPTASGSYRIYRFDHANALSNSTLAVKVPMGGDVYYWVGYRQLYTSTSYNLSDSAYIVAEGLSEGAESNLIDATPGSASPESEDRKDSGLSIGTPFVDSGVTFEATGRGGSTPNEWIDVTITFAARVGFADVDVEIDERAGMVWLTLTRQFSTAGTVSIAYATSNGSAIAGSDYYAVSGSVTWANGDGADKTIGIPIRPDSTVEGRESFTVTLSNPGGASLDALATTATVNVLDPGERYATFTPGFFNNSVYAVVPLADGKVLIGGTIAAASGDFASISNFARLHPDGLVDTSFLTGSGFNNRVRSLVVQGDGKILAGGEFTSYNGTACNRIVRLNSNGTVDGSFVTSIGSGADDVVNSIAIEASGTILVAGDFTTFAGTTTNGLARINANGNPGAALNQPFSAGSGSGTGIDVVVAQADGKIMVGGFLYTGFTPTGFGAGIARLQSNGSLDGTFDPDAGAHAVGATNSLRQVHAIVLLADGDYLVGGRFSAYDENAAPYIVRINSDGSFDSGYTPPAFDDDINAIVLEPSGKCVVAGRFTSPENGIARLDINGNLDSSFEVGTGGGPFLALAPGPGSTLFGGGNFFQFNGISARPIIKLAGGVSAYELWVAENFSAAQIFAGDSAGEANPDGDAFNNATEWALGTSPLDSDPDQGSIEIVASSGSEFVQFSIGRSGGATGAWLFSQFSDDLVNWLPNPGIPGTNAVYSTIAASQTSFIVRDLTPLPVRRFVRFGGSVPE